jgi:hypothetical protein
LELWEIRLKRGCTAKNIKFSNGSNNIRTSGDVRNTNTNTPETKHIAS